MDFLSPVRLSGAVMTHPRRLDAARLLAGADPLGRLQVVTDPEPEGPPTALRTAALAWNCVAANATHHLVLQDDVVLAEGFFEHVERVAEEIRDEAVAFYANWNARNGAVVRLAALTGTQSAYAIQEHVPSLALLLPAELARGYARFAEQHGEGWPYDVVMQRYLNASAVPVRLTVPSTVQHTEVPSIAGNKAHGWRRAALFTGQAAANAGLDCPGFPVVPFYQYGEARCAIRHADRWEYVETDRYLQRIGLLGQSRSAFAAADLPPLPEGVARAAWATGFAVGALVAEMKAEPVPTTVAAAAMETLGPGGLCEDYTVDELTELARPVQQVALAAFAEGSLARQPGAAAAAASATGVRVAVTGGADGLGWQLSQLLGDLGYAAEHVPAPADALATGAFAALVHLGDPAVDGQLGSALAAAAAAGVKRLLYLGSAEIYRGSSEQAVTEDSAAEAPADPVALAWWREEQECRSWGERTGVPVQVLRVADLVGPNVPTDRVVARMVDLAWTRRPLPLHPQRINQVVDHRDLADAVAAVLGAHPVQPVFNVASTSWTDPELAELVARFARRTPWEAGPGSEARQWTMTTELISTELGWQPSADLSEGLRSLAQWYACDIHGMTVGGPKPAVADV